MADQPTWRDPYDFRNYTDQELDDFLKKNAFHQGRPAAVFEHERRQKLADSHLSKERHEQAMQLGSQTLGVGKQGLSWAKIAGIAAIATFVVAVIALIFQIVASIDQHATPAASPASLPQTTATISASPESAVNSNSATPSPQPMATEQLSAPPQ